MTEVRLKIVAPAVDSQLEPVLGGLRMTVYRKGDYIAWGELRVRHFRTGDGSWRFLSHYILQKDDFWGKPGAFDARPDGTSGLSDQSAAGHWSSQLNMNLILHAEKPKPRLAMTLFGFTPHLIKTGSQGNGTLVRGNTSFWVKANPVIGPKAQIITDRTDGGVLNIRWIVSEFVDEFGHRHW